MALRVLHLVGSAVSDFLSDLSRLYARDCLATVGDSALYENHIALVTPDRRWRFPDGLDREAVSRSRPVALAEAIAHVVTLDLDVMVPQMFCLPGMTEYRSLFELLGIPYIGNRPDVMALSAHKARAKAVVASAGVLVPRGEVVAGGEVVALKPPVVVKPVDGDNSLGVTLVRGPDALGVAVDEACAHGAAALVEDYVELGREVRCGVLERNGELVCLPLEEYNVNPRDRPIRDHADKLRRGDDGELALVAKERSRAWTVDEDDPITEVVWEAARRCHEALGCRHYSLFDFRVDPEGQPWFLEAGLYCSFARQSVVAVMAAATGITTPDLFAIALGETLSGREVPL